MGYDTYYVVPCGLAGDDASGDVSRKLRARYAYTVRLTSVVNT